MIDFHCHILPGVDDGAADQEECRAAIGRMHAQGVRDIVVSPHLASSALLRMEERERIERDLKSGWDTLRLIGATHFPDLRFYRGAELMLDHPNPHLELDWVRIAGTRSVLVEFLGMMIPPRAADVLAAMIRRGYVPVVAHPERYRNASLDCREARAWRDAGARLQVNCGSLLGGYGLDAEKRAWSLLQLSAVDYLASDYHARGPYPLTACEQALKSVGAGDQFAILMNTNPSRLLNNLDPVAVPPIDPPVPAWKKLLYKARFW